jgi:hypothetical protein
MVVTGLGRLTLASASRRQLCTRAAEGRSRPSKTLSFHWHLLATDGRQGELRSQRKRAATACRPRTHATVPTPRFARTPSQVKSRRPPLPTGARKRKLEVSGGPPPVTRLSTPECVSSPVSHLRNLTKDLDEGARRERAAQYLRETREQHLQQRRLYLVLDLDETLVHSLRQTVRPLHGPGSRPPRQRQQHAGNGEAGGEEEAGAEGEEEAGEAVGAEAPLPEGAEAQVTLTVQNVQFEMQLRPGVLDFLAEMSELFCVHLYTMGSREYVHQALHHLDPDHSIFKPGQVPLGPPTHPQHPHTHTHARTHAKRHARTDAHAHTHTCHPLAAGAGLEPGSGPHDEDAAAAALPPAARPHCRRLPRRLVAGARQPPRATPPSPSQQPPPLPSPLPAPTTTSPHHVTAAARHPPPVATRPTFRRSTCPTSS